MYDVLLTLCSLEKLRSLVCTAISNCPAVQPRLITPVIAMCSTADVDSPGLETSLKAARLLQIILKHAIDNNLRIQV